MRTARWTSFALALALAPAACGSDPAAPADAMPDRATVNPPVAPPAPPVLTPCPSGWREVATADGPATCDPWPEGGRQTCAGAEAHFPGEPGCRAVGRACPVGDFPVDLPAGLPVVYALAGALAGGDGTETRPYATLVDAVRNADSGGVIAIGKGTYDEDLVLSRSVVLAGACAAETTVRSSRPELSIGAIQVEAPAVTVRDLRVEGERPAVVVRYRASMARLEGVIADGTRELGVAAADSARLELSDVLVRGTRLDVAGTYSAGILAQGGSTLEGSRVVVDRATAAAISAEGAGTIVRLSDTALLDTVVSTRMSFSRGVAVQEGATVDVERTAIERMAETGIYATHSARVTARDLVIRDVTAGGGGGAGRAMTVALGSESLVERALIVRATETGVVVATASLSMTDVILDDTQPMPDGSYGVGVSVLGASTVAATRVSITESRAAGISVEGPDASVTLTDVAVARVNSHESSGLFGRGINMQFGVATELRRVSISDARDIGLYVHDVTGTVEDLSIVGTQRSACADTTCTDQPGGVSLGCYATSMFDVRRFRIADGALAGVQLVYPCSLDLHEGVVEGHPIGANVQFDAYDVGRLSDRVAYRDNDLALDSSMLPVPPPAMSITK